MFQNKGATIGSGASKCQSIFQRLVHHHIILLTKFVVKTNVKQLFLENIIIY